MAIVQYDGELGKFEYDDEEFEIYRDDDGLAYELESYYPYYENRDRLTYIGSETDGSKIRIPEGVEDCDSMFEGCTSLETPPVIPKSVKSCFYMFVGCKSLKEAPIIPNGVKNCRGMFCGTSLETPPVIPEGVENCDSMFNYCTSLKEAPVIPKSVEDCDSMFVGCKLLKEAPIIPNGVKYCSEMFCGTSLETPPVIPDSVEDCDSMFKDCTSLEEAPVIPDSVEYCVNMFEGCKRSVQEQGNWNIEHRGQSYKDCHNVDKTTDKTQHISSGNKTLVYINSINEKCIKQISKDDNSFYAIGIKVDKQMSESGYVNITCNEKNLRKSKSGKSYNIVFDNDHERKSQIVKDGKKETVKLSVSDIAKSHESTFSNRKMISTPNEELSDDKQYE